MMEWTSQRGLSVGAAHSRGAARTGEKKMVNPYVAVLLAALAAWIFGAVYYGVLGRAWMAAQGMSPEEIETRRQVRQMPLGPMVTSFVCELVMAFLLRNFLLGAGYMGWQTGAFDGLLIGAGFMATATLVNNTFPGRKLMLSVIDGAHWIIVAMIMGIVLAELG
jgi:hypothetical protein